MNTLREVQMTGYQILCEVVKICEKNDIRYYLSSGTLLGAVRHGGFIPWDNDVDIEMPVEDYKKFLKIAQKQLPKNLFLQTYITDSGYNEMWAKVRANGTTSLPVAWKNLNMHFGIGIDIFPLAGVYENILLKKIQERALQLFRMLIAKEFVLATNPDELKHNRKLRIIYKLPRKVRVILGSMLERIVLKKTRKSNYFSMIYDKVLFCLNKNAYKKGMLQFENKKFSVPYDYDYVLKSIYGDYMTLPPVEERFYGHEGSLGKIIYDCNRDFREYILEKVH